MSGLFKNPVFQLLVTAVASWFNPVLGAAVAMGFGMYNAQIARQNARDAYNASLKDRIVSVRTTEAPVTIAYGECVVMGPMVYANTSGANQATLVMAFALGPGHEITAIDEVYLNNIPTHPLDGGGLSTVSPWALPPSQAISGVQDIFIATNNAAQAITLSQIPYANQIQPYVQYTEDSTTKTQLLNVVSVVGTAAVIDTTGFTGNQVFVNYATPTAASWVAIEEHLGTNPETAGYRIPNQDPNWTSAHRGDERPWIVLDMGYKEDLFPTGIPVPKARIRGKKLYDPRTGLTVYSTNVALAIRDYLLSPLGFGASTDEINDTLIIAAANICDEIITTRIYNEGTGLWEVTTGKRYTCNGILSTEAYPADNLTMLCEAMGGFAVYSQGKWQVYAGAYRTPGMTLNDSDLVGGAGINIKHYTERRDIFNAVKGTFIDPIQNYQPVNYPAYVASSYVTEDGERIFAEFDFPLTNSSQDAQRLAKLKLGLARLSLSVVARWSFKTYKLQVGDNIYLNLARYGITNRVMRVVRRTFSLTEGVDLTLVEDSSTAYSWVYDEAIAPPVSPDTDLPDPRSIENIVDLILTSGNATLLKLADGTVIPRLKAQWDPVVNENIRNGGKIQVRAKRVIDADWTILEDVPGDSTEIYLTPVTENMHYIVAVRAVNGANHPGFWTSAIHLVSGKSEAPPNLVNPFTVEVLSDGTRKFTVTAPKVADGSQIIVRYVAGSSSNWGAMSQFFVLPYDDKTLTYTYETNLPVSGTWSFGAKLVDSSGNESSTAIFIVGAVLAYSPVKFGAVANLLINSDFTLELGYGSTYYGDTRALYGWSWGGYPASFGRNYNGGTIYNIGRGGANIYIPSNTVGHYAYLWQNVKIEVGVEYEASVYVNIHRAAVTMYLRFLTQDLLAVTGDFTEAFNSGSTAVGDPYNPFNNKRLWAKGVAPAASYWASVLLLVECTATSSPYPWTAWSNVMLCRAPVGVTRETATPWLEGIIPTLPGGVLVGGSVTDTIDSKPSDTSYPMTSLFSDGYWICGSEIIVGSITFTNNTPNDIYMVFQYYFTPWYTATVTPAYATCWSRTLVNTNGGGDVEVAISQFNTANGSSNYALATGVYAVVVPPGTTVVVKQTLWTYLNSLSSFTSTANFKDASLNLQGIRK